MQLRKIHAVLGAAWLLAAAFPSAAGAAVGGTVTDAATGAPIANATVRHAAVPGGVLTDAQGRFSLPTVSLARPAVRREGRSTRLRPALGTFLSGVPAFADIAGRRLAPGAKVSGIAFPGGPWVTGKLPSSALSARAAAAPCLLSVEAAGYKPREANCLEGPDNKVLLPGENLSRFVYQIPVDAGDGLESGDVNTALFAPKALLDGMDSLAAKRFREVHSLLVVKGGKLVLEEYYKGNADTIDFEKGIKRIPLGNIHWTRNGKHYIASCNKALTSILTGMALAKGGKPVTTTLASLLPRYAAQFTGTKANITVEHALTMSLGFQWDEWAGRDLVDMWATPDIGAYVLAKPMAASPGAAWIYNSAGPNLLLAGLESLAGMPMDRFAAEHLYAPLAITDYRWGKQPNGVAEGSAKMFMRPRDMAKLGLLFLKGGVWQGKQVVPADWVAQSTKFHKSAAPKSPNDYAYLWWVRKATTPKGTVVDYYQAEGDGGNYIVVLPAQDMVVVATGGNYGDFGTYDAQMGRIIARHVLPALNL